MRIEATWLQSGSLGCYILFSQAESEIAKPQGNIFYLFSYVVSSDKPASFVL